MKTSSAQLHLDLARYDDQTIRRACVLIHRPSQIITGATGDLCLELAAELDEVLARRADDTRRMAEELDL